MKKDEYLKAIEKLATGYDYEEVQTQIEETTLGTKKKIIRTKKHVPPNFQAAKYLLNKSKREEREENIIEDIKSDNVETFKKEVF